MKLATFIEPDSSQQRAGEVRDGRAVAFEDGGSVLERLAGGGRSPASGPSWPLEDVTLLAPVPRPRAIFGIGLNYAAHVAETGGQPRPERPIVFMKLPSSAAPALIPRSPARRSCAGSTTKASSPWSWVRAARSPATPSPMTSPRVTCRSSSRSGPAPREPTPSAPTARWITTADEVGDPHDLTLRTWVNGELRQDSSTRGPDLRRPGAGRVPARDLHARARRPDPDRHAGRGRHGSGPTRGSSPAATWCASRSSVTIKSAPSSTLIA